MTDNTAAHDGFTLLEVLVSFFILGTFLVAAFGGAGAAIKAYATASQKRAALTFAQNKLESVGVTEPLSAGKTEGAHGSSFLWVVDTAPRKAEGTTYGSAWITVSVFAAGGVGYAAPALVRLRTLKLVTKGGHD